MNEELPPAVDAEHHDLSTGARTTGIVIWSSFLAAGIGTMFFFAFMAPTDLASVYGESTTWPDELGVYTLGFFGLWCLAALASALTLYLSRTTGDGKRPS